MTFVLRWGRDGGAPPPGVADALTHGIARLRDDPVEHWAHGPLWVAYFQEDHTVSIARHRTGVAMVFGRLDAVDDLARKVGDPHAHGSDAELLAKAYECWGERCFEHLLGDYVAVVWDETHGRLSCVRDVVGAAPCYYWFDPTELVVAGHIGAVVSHPRVRRLPNEGYVAEVLAEEPTSLSETLYRDVSRLVAGHALTMDTLGRGVRRVQSVEPWSLAGQRLSPEDWDELYLDVLTSAIRDRMRGADRVGAHVSGGLDSSSIAVLAAELEMAMTGQPLRTFSLVFPGVPECDETDFIAAVVARESIEPTVVDCPPLHEDRLRREVAATSDLPGPPNLPPWEHLQQVARRHGVSRLLDGAGGDHWFNPSGLYPTDLLFRGRLIEAARAACRLEPDRRTQDALVRHLARPSVARGVRRVWPQWRRGHQVPPWVSPGLAARTGLAERLQPRNRSPRSASEGRAGYLSDGWLTRYHEATALAASRSGVDQVSPYFDARLIGFALALNESQRLDGGQRRLIQRRAMRGRLPDLVRLRGTKADFGHLFVEQFRFTAGMPLGGLDAVRERGWVNITEMERLQRQLEEDVRSGRSPDNIWPLWYVHAVDSWARSLE